MGNDKMLCHAVKSKITMAKKDSIVVYTDLLCLHISVVRTFEALCRSED